MFMLEEGKDRSITGQILNRVRKRRLRDQENSKNKWRPSGLTILLPSHHSEELGINNNAMRILLTNILVLEPSLAK